MSFEECPICETDVPRCAGCGEAICSNCLKRFEGEDDSVTCASPTCGNQYHEHCALTLTSGCSQCEEEEDEEEGEEEDTASLRSKQDKPMLVFCLEKCAKRHLVVNWEKGTGYLLVKQNDVKLEYCAHAIHADTVPDEDIIQAAVDKANARNGSRGQPAPRKPLAQKAAKISLLKRHNQALIASWKHRIAGSGSRSRSRSQPRSRSSRSRSP